MRRKIGIRETTAQDRRPFPPHPRHPSAEPPHYAPPLTITAPAFEVHGELVCCLTLFFGNNTHPRSSLKKRKFSFHIKSTGGIPENMSQRLGYPHCSASKQFHQAPAHIAKARPHKKGIKNKPFPFSSRKLFPRPATCLHPASKQRRGEPKRFKNGCSLRLPAPNPCCSQSAEYCHPAPRAVAIFLDMRMELMPVHSGSVA